MRERIGSYRLRQKLTPYLFLTPAIIFFSFMSLGTIVYTIYLSFFNTSLLKLRAGSAFVGIQNYISVLVKDRVFYTTLYNTFYFSVVNVLVGGALALFLAALVNGMKNRALRYTVRTIAFIPVVTSSVAVATIFRWIYHPNFGLLNHLLSLLGIAGPAWLLEPALAMPSVLIMNIWKSVGYRMILFLAGLQSIPRTYYEAAEIDGAGKVRQFLRITWPLLRPTTVFVFVTSFINSFQVFTEIYVLTGGGPGDATRTVVQYIYQAAFQYYQLGVGSAMSVVMFAIVVGMTLINMRISGGNKDFDI